MNGSWNDTDSFVSVEISPGSRGLDMEPVRETIRYDQFVKILFKGDIESMMAIHAAIGVCGEVGELIEAQYLKDPADGSIAPVKEEGGDLEFYLQAIRNHYNVSRSSVASFQQSRISKPTYEELLVIAAGELADAIKREYIYGKPRDLRAICAALAWIDNITPMLYRRDEVIQLNAEKLSQRYVGLKYTDAAAIARADKSGEAGDSNEEGRA